MTFANGIENPDFGPHRPDAAHRVIVTGYYDGAEDGLVQFRESGTVYRFELDSVSTENQPEVWTLRKMPGDAISEFTRILAPHLQPNWPVWLPVWKFATPEVEVEMNRRTDELLKGTGEICCRITSEDPLGFHSYSVLNLETQAV